MTEWWTHLTMLNQSFYVAAGFFSIIFLWQFIGAMLGMGHGDVDLHLDAGADAADVGGDSLEAHSAHEAADSAAAFKVLSLRAVLAFCTMFAWAGALYLNLGTRVAIALLYALAWGLAGWALVAVLVNWMRRLSESGTPRLSSCVGTTGTVYLHIPAGGCGEARVMVSGVISTVKARAADGGQMVAGTPVRVTAVLDHSTISVAPVTGEKTA
ncbi:MAG TPA: hypothetical protein PK082_04900 [Phycisphaerae bacterium]|nr:hypothetical protein [Phycisphaerae bacterium]